VLGCLTHCVFRSDVQIYLLGVVMELVEDHVNISRKRRT
jgi:hypothetical protein